MKVYYTKGFIDMHILIRVLSTEEGRETMNSHLLVVSPVSTHQALSTW